MQSAIATPMPARLSHENVVGMKEARPEYKPRDQFQPFHRKQRWAIIVAHRRRVQGQRVATIID
jgi:hypothetical protein